MKFNAIKLFRNICSVLGLFTLAYAIIKLCEYVVDYYMNVVINSYLAISITIFAVISLRKVYQTIRYQLQQKKNAKNRKLLTYHKRY